MTTSLFAAAASLYALAAALYFAFLLGTRDRAAGAARIVLAAAFTLHLAEIGALCLRGEHPVRNAREVLSLASWALCGAFLAAGPLGPGDSSGSGVKVRLPVGAAGKYYVVVDTEGRFEFVYTDNNTARSEAINVQFVPPP